MTTGSPEDLLDRWRRVRDPEALGALFDTASPGLFRLALSLVPDAATAEDALQETFLFAMEEADRWDPTRPVVPWLAGILRLKVLEVRRRNARAPRPERLPLPPAPDDPSLAAMDAEERERLLAAMQRLPEPYRGVALLRWRYGLEPGEIADVRGVAPGTVWSLLSRAVRRLKVEMGVLPALLLWFRPERGLDGVRQALLRRAAAKALSSAAAAGVGAAVAATAGGAFMAKKALVAVAALFLLAGGGWIAFREDPAPPPASPTTTVASRDTPSTPSVAKPVVPDTQANDGLPPPVDLSGCSRDLDVFGTVVETGGGPIPGASVRTLFRPWSCIASPGLPEYEETVDGPSTRTAVDGSFVLRLTRDAIVDLSVGKAGYAEILVTRCPAGEKVRVVLERGAAVETTVRDAEEKAVPGARVRIAKRAKGTEGAAVREGTTDAQGHCRLEGLPSGGAVLEVSCPGQGRPPSRLVQVPESGTIHEAFTLPASRPVTGRVTDAATGAPIPGARVGNMDPPGETVSTDADGVYRFTAWPRSGQKKLVAGAPGYASMAEPVTPEGTADFELPLGDTVTGRILGQDGHPAKAAKVFLIGYLMHPNGASIRDDHMLVAAKEDGTFSIPGVNHGWSHTLRIAAEGLGRLVVEVPVPPGPAGTIDLGDLILPGIKTVFGVLMDGSGLPIAGQEVWIRRMTPSNMPFADYSRSRTDDLGRFRFHGVAVGDYRLEARLEGNSPTIQKEVAVTAESALVEVRLEAAAPAFRPGRVEVHVLDPAGRPVPGVAISGFAEGARPISRTTDAKGFAELLNLSTPGIRLHLSPPRTVQDPARFLKPAPIDAVVGGAPVIVRLVEGSLIRGRVLGPDGTPLSGMSVNAKGPEKAWAGAVTNAKGEFSLSVASGVPFLVEVGGWRHLDDGTGSTERTNLRADAREVLAPVDGVIFNLHAIPAGKTLTVRVVDLNGKPIPNCSISSPAPAKDNTLPWTDRDGRVTLEGLFEEEIRVTAHQPGGQLGKASLPEGTVMPAPVTVIPRGQEITLSLRKGVARSGRVLDGEGRPVEKAAVMLQTDDFVSSMAWSRADGTFTAWVSPGSKLMRATASTFLPNGPGQVADLENEAVPPEGEIVFRLQPEKERR